MRFTPLILLLLIAVLLYAFPAGATNNQQGKVSDLEVNGNAVYFRILGAVYTPCASKQRFILNASTAYGRNLYLLLHDAYRSGKEIAVESLETCTLVPEDAEDVINLSVPASEDNQMK